MFGSARTVRAGFGGCGNSDAVPGCSLLPVAAVWCCAEGLGARGSVVRWERRAAWAAPLPGGVCTDPRGVSGLLAEVVLSLIMLEL